MYFLACSLLCEAFFPMGDNLYIKSPIRVAGFLFSSEWLIQPLLTGQITIPNAGVFTFRRGGITTKALLRQTVVFFSMMAFCQPNIGQSYINVICLYSDVPVTVLDRAAVDGWLTRTVSLFPLFHKKRCHILCISIIKGLIKCQLSTGTTVLWDPMLEPLMFKKRKEKEVNDLQMTLTDCVCHSFLPAEMTLFM